jgi:hypothetical protein
MQVLVLVSSVYEAMYSSQCTVHISPLILGRSSPHTPCLSGIRPVQHLPYRPNPDQLLVQQQKQSHLWM